MCFVILTTLSHSLQIRSRISKVRSPFAVPATRLTAESVLSRAQPIPSSPLISDSFAATTSQSAGGR